MQCETFLCQSKRNEKKKKIDEKINRIAHPLLTCLLLISSIYGDLLLFHSLRLRGSCEQRKPINSIRIRKCPNETHVESARDPYRDFQSKSIRSNFRLISFFPFARQASHSTTGRFANKITINQWSVRTFKFDAYIDVFFL